MAEEYSVWIIKSHMTLQDPDMPGLRYHHAIFVQTTQYDGILHHVTGDVTSSGGMGYEMRKEPQPESSESFHSKELLGYTDSTVHPSAWVQLLGSLPTPPQQKAFNIRIMRTEPFKMLNPLRFYEPGESRRPLIKCTEWTMETAIPALLDNGYIRNKTPTTLQEYKDVSQQEQK